MPAESLVCAPSILTDELRRPDNAPLPPSPRMTKTRSFGGMLEPRYIVGAGPLDQ